MNLLTPKLLPALFLATLLSLFPAFLSAQPPSPPTPTPTPTPTAAEPDRRAGIDTSVAFIRNVPRDAIEGSAGFRFQRSFYAPRFWRFVFGFRPNLQFNLSTPLNLYSYASVEAGVRFLILSFLSLEFYLGPRFGLQNGRSGFAALSGMGSTGAWLIHPWRDNRQRLRLGVEHYQLTPFGDHDDAFLGIFPVRHLGGFFGFERSF